MCSKGQFRLLTVKTSCNFPHLLPSNRHCLQSLQYGTNKTKSDKLAFLVDTHTQKFQASKSEKAQGIKFTQSPKVKGYNMFFFGFLGQLQTFLFNNIDDECAAAFRLLHCLFVLVHIQTCGFFPTVARPPPSH